MIQLTLAILRKKAVLYCLYSYFQNAQTAANLLFEICLKPYLIALYWQICGKDDKTKTEDKQNITP